MNSDRKKPGVAFWATVSLVVALVGYPLSFGPACWMASRDMIQEHSVVEIYKPLVYASVFDPTGILARWADVGTPNGGMIFYLLQDLNPEPGPPAPPGVDSGKESGKKSSPEQTIQAVLKGGPGHYLCALCVSVVPSFRSSKTN